MNFFIEAPAAAGFACLPANLIAPCDALRFASGRVLRSVAQVQGLPPTEPSVHASGSLSLPSPASGRSLNQPPAKDPHRPSEHPAVSRSVAVSSSCALGLQPVPCDLGL